MSLLESKQNRGRPLVQIGYILAWGPCAGKVNEILLGMTAHTKLLHERHRCCIERRNGTTSVGSDAKTSPKVWQLQFHVNKTAKDSSLFAMRVSCIFSAKHLQNCGIHFCKDVKYEECWSIAPKKSKTNVLVETQHLLVNQTVRYNVEFTHVDLDCSCLLLHKLLHPFIIVNGYPCDTQPCRGDASIHA